MKKKILVIMIFVFLSALNVSAQGNQTRPKVAPSPTPTPKMETAVKVEANDKKGVTQVAYVPKEAAAKQVLAAFDKLINGIRNADVEAVTNAYWNSSQLLIFNYNGTVTRSWEQVKSNVSSLYGETKDVVLDVTDIRVQMLGKEGAAVSCSWKQTQNFRGESETATGRMTLIYRLTGKEWKVIQRHTSPDRPDPSRVPKSEQ